MLNILKKQHGMNIVGQGGKIILFMLPSLIAAICVHKYFPTELLREEAADNPPA